MRAELDFLQGLKARGTAFEIDYIEGLKGHPTEGWYEFTGIGDIKALEEKYLPVDAMAAKYAAGRGHMPGGSVIVDKADGDRAT